MVRLRVASDAPGELHLHGYRLEMKITPASESEIKLQGPRHRTLPDRVASRRRDLEEATIMGRRSPGSKCGRNEERAAPFRSGHTDVGPAPPGMAARLRRALRVCRRRSATSWSEQRRRLRCPSSLPRLSCAARHGSAQRQDFVVPLGPVLQPLRAVCRVISVVLLCMVVVAGLFGTRNPEMNLAPILVWIIWWVGLSFVVACIGNIWPALDPWRALFEWVDAAARRLGFAQTASASVWPIQRGSGRGPRCSCCCSSSGSK